MDQARIAELLEPFLDEAEGLTTGDLDNISMYIDILLRWNARINLTAVRDPERIVTRHFGESLFAAIHLFPERARVETGDSPVHSQHSSASDHIRVADVGSGAGFPGLPIRLWAPHVALTLIESNHKKSAFLREVARALTLTDIDIQTARAETLLPRGFDVVILRAVESFGTILPATARLVALKGRLALLIGEAQLPQAQSLLPRTRQDASQPCWSWQEPLRIPLSNSRILVIAARDKEPA